MTEQLIKSLLELYRQDIRDYSEMKHKMLELISFLQETDKGSHEKKVNSDVQSTHYRNKDLKEEESPINANYLNSGLEDYDRVIQEFAAYRQQLFDKLRERAETSADIQKRACLEIGEKQFRTYLFKPYLTEDLYDELFYLAESIRKVMAEILEMDKKVLEKMQSELNVVRKEIHRIKGVKKTRNAYGKKTYIDALFIDRTK